MYRRRRSNSDGPEQDKLSAPPVAAVLVVLATVLALFWLRAFQVRSSTVSDRIAELRHYEEVAKASSSLKSDLSALQEEYRLADPADSELRIHLKEELRRAELDVASSDKELQEADRTWLEVDRRVDRWWWSASAATVVILAYGSIIPLVWGSLMAEREIGRETDLESVTGAEPTIENLWIESRARLQRYHDIAFEQSKRSFLASLSASVAGAVAIFGALAASWAGDSNRGVGSATVVVGLAGIGGAFSAYIAKTFHSTMVRSSEQLETFFLQPTNESRALIAQILAQGESDDVRKALKVAAVEQKTEDSDQPT